MQHAYRPRPALGWIPLSGQHVLLFPEAVAIEKYSQPPANFVLKRGGGASIVIGGQLPLPGAPDPRRPRSIFRHHLAAIARRTSVPLTGLILERCGPVTWSGRQCQWLVFGVNISTGQVYDEVLWIRLLVC